MKTEEDEAFEDIERRQGGFQAKRAMATDKMQEPVAWVCEGCASDEKHAIDYWQEDVDDIPIGTLLYAAPPQRPWVGLTDEEVNDCIKFPNRNLFARDGTTSQRIARATEAKLKEKNNG
jgi:hypothetical protein